MMSADALSQLRARVRALEGRGVGFARDVARLGPGLDAELPWGGLPVAALHEVAGPAAMRVGLGFSRRFLERPGALVWCCSDQQAAAAGELYGPGLRPFGIPFDRLLMVRARDPRELQWAAAEALRSSAVACTVLELDTLDLVQSRKLQLAVEAGGGAGLILRRGPADPTPNAALTRFRGALVTDGGINGDYNGDYRPSACLRPGGVCSTGMGEGCQPEPALGRPSGPIRGACLSPADEGYRPSAPSRPVKLSLWRAKGMAPAVWKVIWNEQTMAFDPASRMADRADGELRQAAG